MAPLRKIFWAFILLIFTLIFENGAAKIVILPAFVGYLIIRSNAKTLSSYSRHLTKLDIPLIILSIISAISFILSLTGSTFGEFGIVIAILSTGFYHWMLYLILYGLNDIAQYFDLTFEGRQFIDLFPFMAGLNIATLLFLMFAPGLSLFLGFAGLAVHIVFLVRLARFSQRYFVDPTPAEAPISS